MKIIKKKSYDKLINSFIEKNDNLLFGICLGMQILFNSSNENNNTEGLNLINGEVSKLQSVNKIKLPHVGLNEIKIINNNKFNFIKNYDKEKFYFVKNWLRVLIKKPFFIGQIKLIKYLTAESFCDFIIFKSTYGASYLSKNLNQWSIYAFNSQALPRTKEDTNDNLANYFTLS